MQARVFVPQYEEGPGALEASLGEAAVLVIPGWNGSGAGHWQTIWEQRYPRFRRVEQRDWAQPLRAEWIARIDADIERASSHTFLVAHSLGCVAVAHWAAAAGKKADRVAGAFLVAPPWLAENERCPAQLAGFMPMPLARLPFPSLFVASEDDPYLPIGSAERLASSWGSQLVDVGRQGHINVASGHGAWPAGEGLLRGFVAAS